MNFNCRKCLNAVHRSWSSFFFKFGEACSQFGTDFSKAQFSYIFIAVLEGFNASLCAVWHPSLCIWAKMDKKSTLTKERQFWPKFFPKMNSKCILIKKNTFCAKVPVFKQNQQLNVTYRDKMTHDRKSKQNLYIFLITI